MATTTTNFGWDIPQSTDLVKDGATAIAALGQDIDTALVDLKGGTTGQTLTKASGTDLDFSWATASAGALTLVKTQTIGSGVSTVTVSDAFSSTYDNYRVTISGGVTSASSGITLQLGATATGYYSFSVYGSYSSNTVNGFGQSNTTSIGDFATGSANGIFTVADILAPNLAARTMVNISWASIDTTLYANFKNGYVNNATQYTAFTIAPGTGGVTMTGGTIRVYGYQNS
jgi:hypothetical protein